MLQLTKTKLAIPAVIVLLAAATGGYQVWSQHQARRALDASLASLPPGSVSRYQSMGFNGFTHTLRINGLAIMRDGHPSLTIQQITLHHLAGNGTLADPFEAGSLRLVGTQVWRGSRSLTVSLVEGEKIAVLAPDVPPPAGTPAWLAAPGSGTLLAAGSLTAASIADDEGATLAAASIADYKNGEVRQVNASSFADTHGNRIASLAAHAVDLDGLDAVFDTGRYGPGQPGWPALRPLIGRAEIMGFQGQGDDGSAPIASATLVDFAARPFAMAPTSAYVKSAAFTRDAAMAVSAGTAAITGVHYQDNRTKVAGSLGALSISGYADGALAQASLDGMALSDTGPSRVSVGQFNLAGLNATKLLQETTGGSSQSLIAAARRGGVHLASLAIAHVSVTPPTGHTITLGSIDQTTSGQAPTQFTARLRGLSIPAQSNPELAQGLGALGIDPLVLDLDEAGTYDTATGIAALNPMVLTARGLGSLSISIQFTNVPQDLPQDGSPLAAFSDIGIGPFTIRFTNDGLVGRIIAMEARQGGKTTQEITDAAKLTGSFAAGALLPDQPDAGQQAAAFIADPHVLTITATPAAPVRFSAFLGAGRNAARSALNLHLSAN